MTDVERRPAAQARPVSPRVDGDLVSVGLQDLLQRGGRARSSSMSRIFAGWFSFGGGREHDAERGAAVGLV